MVRAARQQGTLDAAGPRRRGGGHVIAALAASSPVAVLATPRRARWALVVVHLPMIGLPDRPSAGPVWASTPPTRTARSTSHAPSRVGVTQLVLSLRVAEPPGRTRALRALGAGGRRSPSCPPCNHADLRWLVVAWFPAAAGGMVFAGWARLVAFAAPVIAALVRVDASLTETADRLPHLLPRLQRGDLLPRRRLPARRDPSRPGGDRALRVARRAGRHRVAGRAAAGRPRPARHARPAALGDLDQGRPGAGPVADPARGRGRARDLRDRRHRRAGGARARRRRPRRARGRVRRGGLLGRSPCCALPACHASCATPGHRCRRRSTGCSAGRYGRRRTNLLRHSAAATCRIAVGPGGPGVLLEVVNDGAGRPSGRLGGLAGLAERARALEGVVAAGRVGRDGFRLQVAVPLEQR